MFDDSLVESAGRMRTRSKWFAIASFLLQTALVAALILIPFLHPAALPRQALTAMLVAPPPPPASIQIPAHAAVAHATSPLIELIVVPGPIRRAETTADDRPPGPIDMNNGVGGSGPGVMSALPRLGMPPEPPVVKPEPKPRPGPLRISAGVAAGRLIVPIRPVYPIIAREARIQGTVVVEATISTRGLVEHARVVSGPPMLASAALSAIEQAHYEPYRLNGDPVEVETTINIAFKLGD